MTLYVRIRRYALVAALSVGAALLVGFGLVYWQEVRNGEFRQRATEHHLETIRQISQISTALLPLEWQIAAPGRAGGLVPPSWVEARRPGHPAHRRAAQAIEPAMARIVALQGRFAGAGFQATVARAVRQWAELHRALAPATSERAPDVGHIQTLVGELGLTMRQLARLHTIDYEAAQELTAARAKDMVRLFIPLGVLIVLAGALPLTFFHRRIGHTLQRFEAAERALRDSRARLVEAQRIADLGNWNWDIVANELLWSDQIYRIFGLEPQEFGVTYEAFLRSVHPDDRQAVQDAVDRALEERTPYAIRHRIVRPDGAERIVHEQGEVTFGDDGTPLRMAGTVQDVTDLALAERALAEKSGLLEGLVQNSVAIITIKDPDGRYVLVNPEFERAMGVPRDAALGKTPFEIFLRETAEVFRRQDNESAAQDQVCFHENKVLLNDGSIHVYLAVKFPIRTAGGEVLGVATIATDITERKWAEEALRRSEERFRDFAEGANDWAWEMDADLRYTYLSPSNEQYSGIPAAEIIGRTREELYARILPSYSPDDLERWRTANRLLETRQTFRNLEQRWVRPDGEVRYFLCTAKPVFDAQGTFEGYRGVGSDITGMKRRGEEIRKELERLVEERTAELRTAQQELVRKERLATLGQLTGTVSHELRNPLGALRASVASIRKLMPADQPMIRSAIEIIDRSITRCDNIIGDLLDYSRGEALAVEATDLGSWLGALLDEYPAPPGVSVRRAIEPGVEVAFDRERLRRVLINVIENACQAMTQAAAGDAAEPGGTLSVAARRSGTRVEIEVADTGPGIAVENLERIFEPLFSTKSFGVGLGLPIVRRIMASHSGGVEVDSAPGRGARFVLWLPLAWELRRTGS